MSIRWCAGRRTVAARAPPPGGQGTSQHHVHSRRSRTASCLAGINHRQVLPKRSMRAGNIGRTPLVPGLCCIPCDATNRVSGTGVTVLSATSGCGKWRHDVGIRCVMDCVAIIDAHWKRAFSDASGSPERIDIPHRQRRCRTVSNSSRVVAGLAIKRRTTWSSPCRQPTVPPPGPETLSSSLKRNIEALAERRKREAAKRHSPGTPRRSHHGVHRFHGLRLPASRALRSVDPRQYRTGSLDSEVRPSFVILATEASVEAIFLSTFVLISQNRTAAASDRRADLDLHISLLTGAQNSPS